MQTLALSVPLKAGMYDEIRKHRDDIIHGLDDMDHAAHGKARGFESVRMFHQTQPNEALVFFFEAEDMEEAMHPKHNDHEASKKWDAFFQSVAGLSGQFMTEHPEMLVDWHHEDGHKHKPARHTAK
jgi:hypothetical protein